MEEKMDFSIHILCREIDKATGDIVSYVVQKNAKGRDIFVLKMRERYNPELRYYAVKETEEEPIDNFDVLLSYLKRRVIKENRLALLGLTKI